MTIISQHVTIISEHVRNHLAARDESSHQFQAISLTGETWKMGLDGFVRSFSGFSISDEINQKEMTTVALGSIRLHFA